MASVDRPGSSRVAALDGLRAIAILLVLMYHLTPGRDSNQGVAGLLFKVADVGWIGVDLFFVLSGFLITGFLLKVRQGQGRLATFFLRRFARIVPAYFFWLAMVFLVVPFLSSAYAPPDLTQQLPYWLYYANYVHYAFGFTDIFNPGHFWSLAVEMQFYLLWPWVLMRVPHGRLNGVLLGGMALALGLRILFVLSGASWEVTYAWAPMRMDCLLAGSVVANWAANDLRERDLTKPAYLALAAGMTMLALVAWTHHGHDIFKFPGTTPILLIRTVGFTVLALSFGAALVLALEDNLLSRALGWKMLAPIAAYSYGIYLVHFLLHPLFERTFGPALLVRYLGSQGVAIGVYFLVASALSFLLAAASYRLFEQPIIRWAHRR